MKINEQVKELRQKSSDELQERKIELLKQQFSLRMQKGSGQLNENHMFKNIRREISRINTIAAEKIRSEGDK